MRIGINTVGMAPGFGGGEEIFLRKVMEAIVAQDAAIDLVVLCDTTNAESFAAYECVTLKGVNKIAKAVSEHDLDVVFSSYRNAPGRVGVPLVLLVMDLYEAERSVGKKKLFGKASPSSGMAESCSDAAMVVVPSEFIKRELLRLFTVPLNKIAVAPMGVDPVFTGDHRCIVEQPYILAVGKASLRKNWQRLHEAFERIAPDIEHSLVVVGQPGDGEPEWGAKVFRIDRLGNTQLAGLYQHCDFYVCPSLYEGSGITVLEAFASGSIVCAGKIGGIAEIGGDSPIYFNPESVDSMVSTLKRALTVESVERRRRIQSGKQELIDQTWEKCASKALSAFRRALTGI